MKFVAITACPTGIAHSQMAAENLEQTAEKRGHDMHVEIHGAMGTENEIPDDTLAEADAVIIAADTGVSRERFDDHIVVKGTVKDGVNDAEGLIDEAIERVEAAAGETDTVDSSTDTAAETETAGSATADQSAAADQSATADQSAAADQSTAEPDSASENDSGVIARLKRLFS